MFFTQLLLLAPLALAAALVGSASRVKADVVKLKVISLDYTYVDYIELLYVGERAVQVGTGSKGTDFNYFGDRLSHVSQYKVAGLKFKDGILSMSTKFVPTPTIFDKDGYWETASKLWACDSNIPGKKMIRKSLKELEEPCFEVKIMREVISVLVTLEAFGMNDDESYGQLTEKVEDESDRYTVLTAEGTSFRYENNVLKTFTGDKYLGFNNNTFVNLGAENEPKSAVFDSDGNLVSEDKVWACYDVKDTGKKSEQDRVLVHGDRLNDSCVETRIQMVRSSENTMKDEKFH